MNLEKKKNGRVKILGSAFALAMAGFASTAAADAVIFNTGDPATATVALGVNDLGHLNTTTGNIATNAGATGLASKIDGRWVDATSPGCFCEGWGVAVNGSVSGYANDSTGIGGLSLDSFSSTSSTATSAVSLTSMPGLSITHEYKPSSSSDLFEAVVTIANNTGFTVTDTTYRRVMDWDVPPTEFEEYVTIGGTATTTLLKASGDNGFMTADPLNTSGYTISCGLTSDFEDCGPSDHGAVFDFDFGELADGDSRTFSIFYGASTSESAAFASLGEVGAELYSFGQSNGGEVTGEPLTYTFAFKGVGGVVVVPVPEPATLSLFGLGLLGLGAARRRYKA